MIVIGYDGSPGAQAAVGQAATLMPGYPAVILTIAGPARTAVKAISAPDGGLSQERAEQCAAEGAQRGHEVGIDCIARVRMAGGSVADAIIAEARRLPSRAIVVGRRRHIGPDCTAVGGVAQAVLRASPCPVLLVGLADGDEDLGEQARLFAPAPA